MKKLAILYCIFYFLSMNTALAVRVTNLYQGVLPVTTQSPAERNQLAGDALKQVLIKVSGNNDILNRPEIKENLSAASTLMQEFSYVPAPALLARNKPYLLQLNFDPNGINKMLREAGAPIWGQNRPLLLIWLAYEMPNHPAEIVGADSQSPIPVLLKQDTDRRGVPILFPAMDVQDMEQVTANDIVMPNLPKLLAAAKRYASDAILIGQMQQTATGYTAQWKLIMGNDQWGWTITGPTIADTLVALADHVADTLAGRYATVITNTVQANFTMKITGVQQAEDFVQVTNYIKHLTPVSNVELEQISGSDMYLKISLRGSQASFTQALSVGQKLTPVAQDGKQDMLVYQWNH